MSLHRISIKVNRASAFAKRQFPKDVEAEINLPAVLKIADFVKGQLLYLTITQLHVLSRMRKVSLYIEKRRYRIVSLDESGGFVALKD